MRKLFYLSEEILSDLNITGFDLIESIEYLLKSHRKGNIINIPKSVLDMGNNRLFMSMMASSIEPPFASIKSLGLYSKNTEKNLPSVGSIVTLFDTKTGLPLAIMDGAWITAIRTAGLSAFVAKKQASPNSKIIAFIGCGVQARSHLEIFSELFSLTEIRAYARGDKNKKILYQLANNKKINIIKNTTFEETVKGADIIISSVSESDDLQPFLSPKLLKEGVFVSMVDMGRSWLKNDIHLFDEIFIDDKNQESKMFFPMIDTNNISGDLFDLVNTNAKQNSLKNKKAFLFRGIALGDLSLAILAYQKANEKSLGVELL